MSYRVYRNATLVFDDSARVEIDTSTNQVTIQDSYGDDVFILAEGAARAVAKFLYEELGL